MEKLESGPLDLFRIIVNHDDSALEKRLKLGLNSDSLVPRCVTRFAPGFAPLDLTDASEVCTSPSTRSKFFARKQIGLGLSVSHEPGEEYVTLLQLACELEREECIRTLLRFKPTLDVDNGVKAPRPNKGYYSSEHPPVGDPRGVDTLASLRRQVEGGAGAGPSGGPPPPRWTGFGCTPLQSVCRWKRLQDYSTHTARISAGNVKLANLLLRAGADPNACWDPTITPLHLAVSNDNQPLATLIMQHGGSPLTEASAHLMWISANRSEDLLSLLLTNSTFRILQSASRGSVDPETGDTAVHVVCDRWRHIPTFTHDPECLAGRILGPFDLGLLQEDDVDSKGARDAEVDTDREEAIIRSGLVGGEEAARDSLVGSEFGVKLGVSPRFSSQVKLIRTFLSWGADVNARNGDGWTPLHLAWSQLNASLVYHLIREFGADYRRGREEGKTVFEEHPSGCHAMLLLLSGDCRMDNEEVKHSDFARLLIECGVDPRQRDRLGNTAIHLACQNFPKKLDLLHDLLTASGPEELNHQNGDGETPLWIAALGAESRELVGLLLERGADPNAPSVGGCTVLQGLANRRRPFTGVGWIASMLVGAGATHELTLHPESTANLTASLRNVEGDEWIPFFDHLDGDPATIATTLSQFKRDEASIDPESNLSLSLTAKELEVSQSGHDHLDHECEKTQFQAYLRGGALAPSIELNNLHTNERFTPIEGGELVLPASGEIVTGSVTLPNEPQTGEEEEPPSSQDCLNGSTSRCADAGARVKSEGYCVLDDLRRWRWERWQHLSERDGKWQASRGRAKGRGIKIRHDCIRNRMADEIEVKSYANLPSVLAAEKEKAKGIASLKGKAQDDAQWAAAEAARSQGFGKHAIVLPQVSKLPPPLPYGRSGGQALPKRIEYLEWDTKAALEAAGLEGGVGQIEKIDIAQALRSFPGPPQHLLKHLIQSRDTFSTGLLDVSELALFIKEMHEAVKEWQEAEALDVESQLIELQRDDPHHPAAIAAQTVVQSVGRLTQATPIKGEGNSSANAPSGGSGNRKSSATTTLEVPESKSFVSGGNSTASDGARKPRIGLPYPELKGEISMNQVELLLEKAMKMAGMRLPSPSRLCVEDCQRVVECTEVFDILRHRTVRNPREAELQRFRRRSYDNDFAAAEAEGLPPPEFEVLDVPVLRSELEMLDPEDVRIKRGDVIPSPRRVDDDGW